MHDGNTVTLRQTQNGSLSRFGLEIKSFIRDDGRAAYQLTDKMSGKVLARSRSYTKVYNHGRMLADKKAA